jgi:hypothetical protein
MSHTRAYALAAGAVSLVAIVALQYRRNRQHDRDLHSITPSPKDYVLSNLGTEEKLKLAYHPDQFPGSRDVQTPWGNTRVYEFGPEDGQKVLFVHGISTPCISLGELANDFVERGCRVMLYGESPALLQFRAEDQQPLQICSGEDSQTILKATSTHRSYTSPKFSACLHHRQFPGRETTASTS